MTQQEAEVYAARLTRIWVIEGASSERVTWTTYEDVEATTFWTRIEGDIRLFCDDEYQSNGVERRRIFRLMHRTGTSGYLQFRDGKIGVSDAVRSVSQKELCQQFAAQWLPFFRRGCWLSGCHIEASAHEKAEWTQGFTRKEVETWDLKM